MAAAQSFRLASLLNLRRAQEDRAAADLAAAAADRERAQQRREATAAALGATTFPDGTAEMVSFAAVTAARAAMSSLLSEHTALLSHANGAEQARQKDWHTARAKTTALEKLEGRHTEARRIEEGRAEQIVLDEIASTRARRKEATA